MLLSTVSFSGYTILYLFLTTWYRHACAWQTRYGETHLSSCARAQCRGCVYYFQPGVDQEGCLWFDEQGYPCFRCNLGFLMGFWNGFYIILQHNTIGATLDWTSSSHSLYIICVAAALVTNHFYYLSCFYHNCYVCFDICMFPYNRAYQYRAYQ